MLEPNNNSGRADAINAIRNLFGGLEDAESTTDTLDALDAALPALRAALAEANANPERDIYRDALDRIARGEFAADVNPYERIVALREVAREALGKGHAQFFAREMARTYGTKI